LLGTAALIGLGVVIGISPTPWIAVPAVVVWAGVVMMRLGVQGIVTFSMMAAAFTAPLNGVRVPGGIGLVDVFLVIAMTALAADYLRRERTIHPVPSLLARGLCLLALGGIIGTLFASDPVASASNLARFMTSALFPIIIMLSWQPDQPTVERFSWFWLAGAMMSALIALASPGDISGRPAGLAGHSNQLAIISAFSAGVALAIAVHHHGIRRFVAGGSVVVFVVANLQSGSRAGVVALAVMFAVVAIRRGVNRGALVICGLLLVLTVGLIGTGKVSVGRENGLSRLLGDTTTAESDQARRPLLRAGVNRIGDYPLTGSGFEKALEAHNIYVQVWAAAGITGLVGLLLVGWSTVRLGLQAAASRASPVAVGYVASYLGYLVAGLFQNILWDRYVWLFVAITVWLGILAQSKAPEPIGAECA
jgi:hypothetical protein